MFHSYPRPGRIRQAGFTLLELLVAMAIFSVIGVASYYAWANLQIAKQRTEQQSTRIDELERAWYWIAEDLEQSIDRPVRDQLGGELAAFTSSSGEQQLLSLTRAGWTNPAAGILPNRSTLQRVSYSLLEGKLYRDYWYHLDGIDAENRKRRLLIREVDTLTLRFLDSKDEWQDDWPARSETPEALPKAVELTLALDDMGEIKRRFAVP